MCPRAESGAGNPKPRPVVQGGDQDLLHPAFCLSKRQVGEVLTPGEVVAVGQAEKDACHLEAPRSGNDLRIERQRNIGDQFGREGLSGIVSPQLR